MDQLATKYWSRSGVPTFVHFVPFLPGLANPYQTSLVRIFNREDHYVRIELRSLVFGHGAWCDLPPYYTLTMDGEELHDLIYRVTYGELEGRNWNLVVRVAAVQPDYEPAGLYCQSQRDGHHNYNANGRPDSVGVLVLAKDGEGNLINLINSPSLNLTAPYPLPPHRGTLGDFNITFDFGEGFNDDWRLAAQYAAARWEQIIVADFADSTIDNLCGTRIPETTVDDLLIRLEYASGPDRPFIADATTCATAPGTGRPITGRIRLNAGGWDRNVKKGDGVSIDRALIHELGHVLGIGVSSGYVERGRNPNQSADLVYFAGPNALSQFERIFPNDAKLALEYGYEGVPLEDDGGHWLAHRLHVAVPGYAHNLKYDIMSPGGGLGLITAVTVGALEDLGYEVNYSQADK